MKDYTEEREAALAKATTYVAGPYVPGGFGVHQRDTHHFDISARRRPGYVEWYLTEKNTDGMAYPLADGVSERAFCIRGELGEIYLRDERWDKERPHPRGVQKFPSVEAAMAWIAATLLVQPKETP